MEIFFIILLKMKNDCGRHQNNCHYAFHASWKHWGEQNGDFTLQNINMDTSILSSSSFSSLLTLILCLLIMAKPATCSTGGGKYCEFYISEWQACGFSTIYAFFLITQRKKPALKFSSWWIVCANAICMHRLRKRKVASMNCFINHLGESFAINSI